MFLGLHSAISTSVPSLREIDEISGGDVIDSERIDPMICSLPSVTPFA
jgi:hypothetical protein